ncbi:MAG: M28 family peptidase [Pseudobdellovibrionaceae bacterium]
MKRIVALVFFFFNVNVQAHINGESPKTQKIFADLKMLEMLKIPMIAKSESAKVGYAEVTPEVQMQLQKLSHDMGKCGAFEVLPEKTGFSVWSHRDELANLEKLVERNQQLAQVSFLSSPLEKNEKIEAALGELKEQNLIETVKWMSAFPDRYNKGQNANVPVLAMQDKLIKHIAEWNQGGRWKTSVDLISHSSTPQKSIRVRLEGTKRPNEIVVLGGHFDSISGFFGSGKAPGADDNASGSSNILEALRVLLAQDPLERTVEFFWYAGEESGLLGSAEIAQAYKREQKNVVAVLQLDMTLFPGEGEFVIGNMQDFTNASLRNYLEKMNDLYFKIRLVSDECGYGCSDHASWYRQGYATLMPFEATSETMNRNIHTPRDLITPQMSFRHSLVFSKIALVFAMDLGNSMFIPSL